MPGLRNFAIVTGNSGGKTSNTVMLTIETAIRLIVIGQQLLVAAVLLAGSGGRAARTSGALLMLSVDSYLYTSDTLLSISIPLLQPITVLLALIVPYCLWLFARAIFEAPWPRPIVLAAFALIGIVVWVIHLAGIVNSRLDYASHIVMHFAGLAAVAHALWLTAKGRPDDLLEKRRAFRLFFVVVVSMQVAAVQIMELVLGDSMPPAWLELGNIIIIAVLTFGLAIPLLRLDAELFGPETRGTLDDTPDTESSLSAAGSVLSKKLLDLMDGGYYQETGLTIRMLAEKLDYPEHQLRRLINGHLGYRNFSAFLNHYRIDAAKAQLADPDRARTPVLTIALNLGYASLGPFNRAFKAATEMTPTDYRQKNIKLTSADTE